ncbi:MAG: Nramp family divalent metal transporter [Actinobacteria bacterium]|nr:Nramp family divalent metal transporter [Actinomycetota bacterium]MDI6830192.1 Nramp family divalent metal transporter [Actinomycetota bacterium]
MPAREGRRKRRLTRRELLLFLAVLGPGIIVNMVDTDAGGIATYSVSGARYGYDLLWVLTVTAVFLALIQEVIVRLGTVTGRGLAALIRERFSLRLTALVMLALLFTNFANTVSNFAGLAASLQLFHLPPLLAIPPLAFAVWWLVVKGTYKRVEKIFLVVSLVYIAYFVSAFLAGPDWSEVGRSLVVPRLSMETPYLVLAVTNIGTTIAPWMLFYQQSSIVDKGLDADKLAYERADTLVGVFFAVVVGMFIIICCAAAFYYKPGVGAVNITSAEEAAAGLAPVAGGYASYLFAFGLFAASLFAASILPLTTAYTVCEAFGWEATIDRPYREAPQFYLTYTLFIAGSALLVMIPRINLVFIMVASQTLNGILLPVIVTFMMILVNDRELMGEYANSPRFNAVMWTVTVFLYLVNLAMIVSTFIPSG